MGERGSSEEVRVDDILEYLAEWKSTKEIVRKFHFSNTQWHNMRKFLTKGQYIVSLKCRYLEEPKRNYTVIYRAR